MPLWFSPGINYPLLSRCREQVRTEMLKAKWNGGQWKFEEVMNRRAWKRYSLACRNL